MSFPAFPVNGQVAVVGNIGYVYSVSDNTWTKQQSTTGTISSLSLTATTSSVSTTTGALVVAGGIGVGGNIYAGGTIFSNGLPIGSSSTFIGGLIFSATQITCSSISVSPTTGALTVAGGVGISGSLNVASTSYIAGAQIVTTATIGQFASSSGTNQIFTISNPTSSTNTTTGALIVQGGAGIAQNLNVGGTIVGGGVRSTTASTPPSNPAVGDIWYNSSTDVMYRWTFDGTSYYWVDEYTTIVTGVSATSSKSIAFSLLFGG
jgi:hypothetical protein